MSDVEWSSYQRVRLNGSRHYVFSAVPVLYFGAFINQMHEVRAWCIEQFGPPSKTWEWHDYDFLFIEEVDATAFKLRWL